MLNRWKYPSSRLRLLMGGGLGNQLFQFYAGLEYAIQTKRNLILDYSQMNLGFTTRVSRIPEEILASVKSSATVVVVEKKRHLLDIFIRISRLVATRTKKEKILHFGQSPSIGFSASFNADGIHYLSGYFQTWKHYQSLMDKKIISEIDRNPRGNGFDHWINSIHNEKPIVVHIRRGDYRLLAEKWGLLSPSYFHNAVRILLLESPDSKILVFSDEPEEAKRIMQGLSQANIEFFPNNLGLTDFEELLLMGSSNKLVISNSTFSWWAGMLGNTEKVLAPSKWFRGMEDPQDLIPEKWQRVESEWET